MAKVFFYGYHYLRPTTSTTSNIDEKITLIGWEQCSSSVKPVQKV